MRRKERRHRTVLRPPACALSSLNANQLNGTIPSSMGNLTGLQQLCVRRVAGRPCTVLRRLAWAFSCLFGNQLNGTIPASMGNMTGLQYMCVRHVAGCSCTALRRALSASSMPTSSVAPSPPAWAASRGWECCACAALNVAPAQR